MGFIDGRGRPELIANPAILAGSRAHFRLADTAPTAPVDREPTARDLYKQRMLDHRAALKAFTVAIGDSRAATAAALDAAAAALDAAHHAWLGRPPTTPATTGTGSDAPGRE